MTCFGCKDCTEFQAAGVCTCKHLPEQHQNVNARYVAATPCTAEVMGPTSMSGNIVRTMQCTCNRFEAITQEMLV